MGNGVSHRNHAQRELHVWVLGQRNAGKTHLIDAIKYNGDTSKHPTNGYYIEQMEHMQHVLTMREFGQTERLVQKLSGSEILKLYGAPQCIWYVTKACKPLQSYHLDLNTLLYTLSTVNGHQDTSQYEPIPVAIIMNNVENGSRIYETMCNEIVEESLSEDQVRRSRKAVQLDQLIKTLRLNQYEGRVYACEISFTENLSVHKLLNWTVEQCKRPTTRPYHCKEKAETIHFLERIVSNNDDDSDDTVTEDSSTMDGFLG